MPHVKQACVSVTHSYVCLFLCVTTSQATGCVPWCVWVPQSLRTYVRADLVSSQPWDLAHASCCLLKSPHVLTLSFFLLPTPPLLSPWGSSLETGTLGGEVENGASYRVDCLPPKSALVSWGQTEAIPARSSWGGQGQGQWKEHMV